MECGVRIKTDSALNLLCGAPHNSFVVMIVECRQYRSSISLKKMLLCSVFRLRYPNSSINVELNIMQSIFSSAARRQEPDGVTQC